MKKQKDTPATPTSSQQSACYHRFKHPHPTFTANRSVPSQFSAGQRKGVQWESSLYYVWFLCIARHEGYARHCRTGRGRYAKLYADWGDVQAHHSKFKTWFLTGDRGIRLFSEPSNAIRITIGSTPESFDWLNGKARLIQIDISRPKTYLQKRIAKLIEAEQSKYLQTHTPRSSKARYPIAAGAKSADVYLRMLKVWDLKQAGKSNSEIHRVCYPNTKTIEQKMKAIEQKAKVKGDTDYGDAADAKLKLQKQAYQEVMRDYKAACALIANAARGTFPKTTL